ncbi:MAG: DUF4956 domain-containing protein [Planctomycetaceae bacterium]
MMEFLEVPLFDDDIFKLLVRFGINLLFLSLIVVYAIYPNLREREFSFTAVMLNVIVFFICFTMKKLELDLGLALGLFAVFGVLRYRTDAIRVKEMTYLFIVIGLGVINSLSNKQTSYAEVFLVNSMVFASAMLKERMVGRTNGSPNGNGNDAANAATNGSSNGNDKSNGRKKPKDKSFTPKKAPRYNVDYDRLELLGDSRREDLLHDLRQRTGLAVDRVAIKTIDLLNNKATLTVWTSSERPDNDTSTNHDSASAEL